MAHGCHGRSFSTLLSYRWQRTSANRMATSLTEEASGRTDIPTSWQAPSSPEPPASCFLSVRLFTRSGGGGGRWVGRWAWHRFGWCPRNNLACIGHWCAALFGYLNLFEKEAELPWWLSGKEPTCQCRTLGFDPWVGKFPWRGKRQPTPVFLPGESHGQRNLAGYRP